MLAVSTDSYFTRVADVTGFGVTFWIGVFTALVVLTLLRVRDGITPVEAIRRGGAPLVIAAILQATSTIFFVLAVKNTSISNVVTIIAAAPLFASVVGWLWIRERTTGRVFVAMGASAVGIAIVMWGSAGGGQLLGDAFALGAIATFSVTIVLLRRFPAVSRSGLVGLAGVVMALVSVWPASKLTGHSLGTWAALIAMGAVLGPLARIMLASATRYITAAEVGLFAPLETVLGSLWAFLAFNETPRLATIIGGVIILAGLLWGTWPGAQAPSRPGEHHGISPTTTG